MTSRGAARWARLRTWASHYLGGLYTRSDSDHLFLIAGGLGFSLILCVIPLVLIVFYVLGTLLDPVHLERQVEAVVTRAVPRAAYASAITEVLIARARELVAYRQVFGLVGAAGLLFTTSGLFASMRTALNAIFRVREIRSEIVGKLRDFGMVFLVLCFFLAAVVLMPALEGLQERAFDWPPEWARLRGAVLGLVSTVLIAVVFYLLYALVPYGRMERRALTVAATTAAVLWTCAELGFSWYLDTFPTWSRLYGTYAALVVPLLWIYYASLTFLVGAHVGQLYRERRPPAEIA